MTVSLKTESKSPRQFILPGVQFTGIGGTSKPKAESQMFDRQYWRITTEIMKKWRIIWPSRSRAHKAA